MGYLCGKAAAQEKPIFLPRGCGGKMPQVDKQVLGVFPFPLLPPPTPDICKYHRGTYVIPTKSEKYKHTLKVEKKSGNQKSVSYLRAFPALFLLKKESVCT